MDSRGCLVVLVALVAQVDCAVLVVGLAADDDDFHYYDGDAQDGGDVRDDGDARDDDGFLYGVDIPD